MRQRLIDFERRGSEPPTTIAETAQAATDSSLPPPPPPLVRTDRQIVYEDAAGYEDWPPADSLHNHDTITVDRIHNDIDGPSHRFVIKRGDTVEAWFGKDNLQPGTVVGISHARREVCVVFTEGSNTEESSGQWFAVGAIYPIPADADRNAPTEKTQAAHAALTAPVTPQQVLKHLQDAPGHEFTASELRSQLGASPFKSEQPLSNAVHAALKGLRDKGRIHVEEPRFGEPRFLVLALPESASELTLGHCPHQLAGPQIRYLFRTHGQKIAEFAARWGFTQKHVRQVFDRGLDNQHAVRDWLEAMLTTARPATPPLAQVEVEEVAETAAPTAPTAYTFDDYKLLRKKLYEGPLPEDAFRGVDSFRQTGIRTRLVVINKNQPDREPPS